MINSYNGRLDNYFALKMGKIKQKHEEEMLKLKEEREKIKNQKLKAELANELNKKKQQDEMQILLENIFAKVCSIEKQLTKMNKVP